MREFSTKHSCRSLGLYWKHAKNWGSSLKIFLLKALEGVYVSVSVNSAPLLVGTILLGSLQSSGFMSSWRTAATLLTLLNMRQLSAISVLNYLCRFIVDHPTILWQPCGFGLYDRGWSLTRVRYAEYAHCKYICFLFFCQNKPLHTISRQTRSP